MSEDNWLDYLGHFRWDCPGCGHLNQGVREDEKGQIVGRCGECRETSMLYIWAGDGWLYAPTAGIILETD